MSFAGLFNVPVDDKYVEDSDRNGVVSLFPITSTVSGETEYVLVAGSPRENAVEETVVEDIKNTEDGYV